MDGNIVSLKQFVNGIKESQSYDPQALPLRPKGSYPDWVDQEEARNYNKSNYRKLRNEYSCELFGTKGDSAGLYFICSSHKDNPFYYIGLSKNLIDRVDKHLLTKDYYFFMLAFPNNKTKYYNEAKRFYFEDGQKYDGKYDEFERQYRALEKASGINSIAWVSNSLYNSDDWERLESFFVTTYQPPGNGTKLNENLTSSGFAPYRNKFEAVRDYLYKNLIPNLKAK